MIYFTAVCGLIFANSAFCQAANTPATDEERILYGFVQLGHFSDRGVAECLLQKLGLRDIEKSHSQAAIAVPPELLALLETREKILVRDSSDLPWPVDLTKRGLDAEDLKPAAVMNRFRKIGLIELFLNENTKLLDSPLTERKELMKRVKELTKEVDSAIAIPFVIKSDEPLRLIVSGHIRKVSVDLDTEIFKSLSPAERERISKVVGYVLPGAIADAKKYNRDHELGSDIWARMDNTERK